MRPFAITLLVASAALGGCSTVQDDVRNDREAAIARCVRQVDLSGPRFKAHAMTYMGVSRESLATTMCDRLANGVAEGRIDQSDINRLIRTGQLTSKFSFLRG
ncbi:hypothetical protein [Kumtagia ephedrae]|jgi:hypothetical protein|uniref:hypothetical protein n=1 Tax=Kumtagia ephedrae TaxID=2116701 RepID=UPI0010574F64|nr:hypothetical protein [Mesorhizobium ephedrae]